MTRSSRDLPGPVQQIQRFLPALALVLVSAVFFPMGRGDWALGFLVGLLTALIAIGLALIFRANRIINFAQGDLGTVPTTVTLGLVAVSGLPWVVAVAAGLAVSVLLGAIVEFFIVRRFWRAPRLLLTVATIGLSQLLFVVSALLPRWWGETVFLKQQIPDPFQVDWQIGNQTFHGSEILALVLAPTLMAALALILARTDLGLAVRATAERSDRAALLGVPVRRLQTVVWATASLLSFVGVFLQISIFGGGTSGASTSVQALTLALAAFVLGRMEDLPAITVSAVALRILTQGVTVHNPMAPSRVYLVVGVVILVGLVFRKASGRRVDSEAATSWHDAGEVRPVPIELRHLPVVRIVRIVGPVLVVAIAVALPIFFGPADELRASLVAIYALIALSVLVLTGWAGQVSLGQMSFVAVGAAVGAVATATWDLDLTAALLIAGIAGALVAIVVGLPAFRLPGLYLAVTTLAFALACSNFLLNRKEQSWIPRDRLDRPPLLRTFDLTQQDSMYWFVLAVVVLCFLAVTGIRRSRTGRAIIAARDNEAGATAYSIGVTRAKLTAFALSGFLAAVAGCLLVHVNQAYTEQGFVAADSLSVFTAAVVGGLGSWIGPVLGSVFLSGGNFYLQERWRLLPTAIGVLGVLLVLPGGLADLVFRGRDALLRRLARKKEIVVPSLLADTADGADVPPALHIAAATELVGERA
ncbi:MAG: ABC transporter permease [Acidimicrobiales bacterium]|nr:ABC transporter permease [Acidimicrobiales bacterium]